MSLHSNPHVLRIEQYRVIPCFHNRSIHIVQLHPNPRRLGFDHVQLGQPVKVTPPRTLARTERVVLNIRPISTERNPARGVAEELTPEPGAEAHRESSRGHILGQDFEAVGRLIGGVNAAQPDEYRRLLGVLSVEHYSLAAAPFLIVARIAPI